MKFIHFAMISLTILAACNRRSDKTQAEASPTQNGGDASQGNQPGVTPPANQIPDPATGLPLPVTPDTRPVSASVSTQTFACDTLESGIYWFGKGDMAQKVTESTRSSFYDPSKPTVIYAHGWQAHSHKLGRRATFNYTIYGLDVDTADAWIDAGWNIGIYYWNQIGDESAPNAAEDKVWGDSPVTWKNCDGIAQPVPGNPASVADSFYTSYMQAMKDYRGDNIRVAGHSLGNQLATKLAAKLSDDSAAGKIDKRLVPKRVALIDPWWSAPTRTLNRASQLKSTVESLKAKGIIMEWYRTSDVNENRGSAENLELLPIIGRTDIDPTYYLTQTSRHSAAPLIYFLSFGNPAPKGCALPCTDLAPSASTSDARMLELMAKPVHWQQLEGQKTPATSDNTFTKKPF